MFTDGLDETAINWIKKVLFILLQLLVFFSFYFSVFDSRLKSLLVFPQGRDTTLQDETRLRSPLAEKTSPDLFPKSPLAYNTIGFMSSHALPPLKFHSGLLPLHSLASPSHNYEEDDDDGDYDINESIASVPFEEDGDYSDDDGLGFQDFDEDAFSYQSSVYSGGIKASGTRSMCSINRGHLKENLRIEVPVNLRRCHDGKLGLRNFPQNFSTPNYGSQRQNQVRFHSARVRQNLQNPF